MCGIIGYCGTADASERVLAGLKLLEYRGYDSAGLAIGGAKKLQIVRSANYGKSVGELVAKHRAKPFANAQTGIGHTRWATHGAVSETNAHPIADSSEQLAVVHNGIIENYAALKRELEMAGLQTRTETDSEVFLLLLQLALNEGADLQAAVGQVAKRVRGSSTLLVMAHSQPNTIVGVRIGSAGGLVVAQDAAGVTVTSDAVVLVGHYAEAVHLGSGEMVCIDGNSVVFSDLNGKKLTKKREAVSKDQTSISKGEHEHFFIKEVLGQPQTLRDVVRERVDFGTGRIDILGDAVAILDGIRRVVFVGMGSSHNAAQLAAMQVEYWARLPATAELASEFHYRQPVLDERTLFVCITQSGETADTLVALNLAQKAGARTIAVVEQRMSLAARTADCTLTINAGTEVSVAASKTFTATMLTLTQLAIQIATHQKALPANTERELVNEIADISHKVEIALDANGDLAPIAEFIANSPNMLYMGRFFQYPISCEGALKMKETAYIHAEAVSAGNMRHGVNALITPAMPIVAIATQCATYEKMVSDINVVRARQGKIIAVMDKGNAELADLADYTLTIPATTPALAPIVTVVPLQLLAYQTTLKLGKNPDRPRNLAKTVTVE